MSWYGYHNLMLNSQQLYIIFLITVLRDIVAVAQALQRSFWILRSMFESQWSAFKRALPSRPLGY